MKKMMTFFILFVGLIVPVYVLAMPTVYPTGTTIFKPAKAWNGYTIFCSGDQLSWVLIDMNGNTVKTWTISEGKLGPCKLLPDGVIMGGSGVKEGYQDFTNLIKVDWDGNVIWNFDQTEQVEDKGAYTSWSARFHHDFQLEGNPVGYYVPGMNFNDQGNILFVSHKNWINPEISEKVLEDDIIIEVDNRGNVLWEWLAGEHFDEMGFDEEAKNAISRNPGSGGDWMHINNVNYLGQNQWFDKGDERFHPENIIIDGRATNTIMIIDKKTGDIVWQIGPDYTKTPALKKLGQIIGQHHAHMIPRGLPGEGNILLFDNGGQAGYGNPNPGAPTGVGNALRSYSRVIEFDPVTLEIKWEYTYKEAGYSPLDHYKFFSHFISSAQRLANGNTLITEGADGRFFEVTPDHELVWEYVNPYFSSPNLPGSTGESENKTTNCSFRAYRVPYEWVPQLKKPIEKAVTPPANWNFTVPGTARIERDDAITMIDDEGIIENDAQEYELDEELGPGMLPAY